LGLNGLTDSLMLYQCGGQMPGCRFLPNTPLPISRQSHELIYNCVLLCLEIYDPTQNPFALFSPRAYPSHLFWWRLHSNKVRIRISLAIQKIHKEFLRRMEWQISIFVQIAFERAFSQMKMSTPVEKKWQQKSLSLDTIKMEGCSGP
jgi:hypothetical protein